MARSNHTYKGAMEAVDKALYQAKANGRNKVALGVIEESSEDQLQ